MWAKSLALLWIWAPALFYRTAFALPIRNPSMLAMMKEADRKSGLRFAESNRAVSTNSLSVGNGNAIRLGGAPLLEKIQAGLRAKVSALHQGVQIKEDAPHEMVTSKIVLASVKDEAEAPGSKKGNFPVNIVVRDQNGFTFNPMRETADKNFHPNAGVNVLAASSSPPLGAPKAPSSETCPKGVTVSFLQ